MSPFYIDGYKSGDAVICVSAPEKTVELVAPMQIILDGCEWWAWDDMGRSMCKVSVGKFWIHKPEAQQ